MRLAPRRILIGAARSDLTRRRLETEPESVQGTARIGRIVDADHRRTLRHLTHSIRARDRLPRASLTTLLVAPRDGRQDEREERNGPQSFENRLDFRFEDSHVSPVLPVPQDGCHLTTSTMRNTASRERIPLRP